MPRTLSDSGETGLESKACHQKPARLGATPTWPYLTLAARLAPALSLSRQLGVTHQELVHVSGSFAAFCNRPNDE